MVEWRLQEALAAVDAERRVSIGVLDSCITTK